jgi:hypothetical protein
MAGCWTRLSRYFFPRDLTPLYAGSLIVGITTYRVIKFVIFVLMLAIVCYNQTTIEYILGLS